MPLSINMSVTILGGDIGGTNSRFQLFRVQLDDSALLTPLKPGKGAVVKHDEASRERLRYLIS
jgi:hypothetical protein